MEHLYEIQYIIVCGIYVLKTNRTSTNRDWITEISNLHRISMEMHSAAMKKCSEAINKLPCFGCLSLLVEHSGKSGWNLKRFEYFTSISHSFSQMMFGFCCCFFYLSASQCEAGKIRKYFFFHVHKCFRYRITIPKNYTTRMSITGRQSFCIRAAPALFSEELMYAIRSEWFFSKPFSLHSWCKWNCYRSYSMVFTSFLDSLG